MKKLLLLAVLCVAVIGCAGGHPPVQPSYVFEVGDNVLWAVLFLSLAIAMK